MIVISEYNYENIKYLLSDLNKCNPLKVFAKISHLTAKNTELKGSKLLYVNPFMWVLWVVTCLRGVFIKRFSVMVLLMSDYTFVPVVS